MKSDQLIDYQRKMLKDNPVFPIRVDDYNKFNEYVITVKGLEQLHILKRQVIMGKATIEEITILERLLNIYAHTNPSKEKLREWKNHIDRYMRELMKTRFNPDLEKEGLAVKNDNFDPKYFEIWSIWNRTIVQKIYALQKEEVGI